MIERIAVGLARIELVDRSMTLAGQMFTSVLPVLIAMSALVDGAVLGRILQDRFSIDAAIVQVEDLQMTSQTAAFGVFGALMVVISGTSFTRALGRMYGRIWNVRSLELMQGWRWFAVLFTVAASIVVVGAIQSSGMVLPIVIGQWCVWACTWTWCPRLLTVRAVPAPVLWATGAVTATLLSVVDSASRIVMPRAVASSADHFGVLGVVFAGVGWLFAVAVVLVASPVIADAVMRVPAVPAGSDAALDPAASDDSSGRS
ncbi:hypothetical protein [Rhodococcus yananensis]|uniref:hypothetical protein n=1 Tax=Rhodococcus yananensis TaxID=2879464 RepID=UPI001CF90F52|nr:hypothetical protein [Rhodococcus yananensis]